MRPLIRGRLATRLLLAFTAVAALPLLVVPLVIRQVSASYDRTFAADLENADKVARTELEQLGTDVRLRTKAVAESGLLTRLQRASEGGDSSTLLGLAAPALTESGLDVLEVIDNEGRILLCGQLPVRLGDLDATVQKLMAHPSQPLLMRVDYKDHEELRQGFALVTALPSKVPGIGGILGGRFFGDEELARLSQVVRGQVTLDGAATTDSWRTKVVTIPAVDGEKHLQIQLSDEALVQTKRRIVVGALVAFVLALVVGVALAAWLARRTVQPIEALVEGTRRVAAGDLSYRVNVTSTGELAQLVDAFNGMSSELAGTRDRLAHAERIAAWEQIARALAHEIKNPLTPIAMAIETLQRTHDRHHPEFDRFFKEGTATVLEEVARLKHLATEFGEFARWPKPVMATAAPTEIIRSVAQLYGTLPPPHLLETEIEQDLPLVLVDRDQLQRALVNMVKNALEAMPAGGRVLVRAVRHPSGVALEVVDNGPGLSADVRSRMFEPYFTTKAEGTGLGLAIVHRIVTEHGGKLTVDETPGGGTTFRMTLPSVRDARQLDQTG